MRHAKLNSTVECVISSTKPCAELRDCRSRDSELLSHLFGARADCQVTGDRLITFGERVPEHRRIEPEGDRVRNARRLPDEVVQVETALDHHVALATAGVIEHAPGFGSCTTTSLPT